LFVPPASNVQNFLNVYHHWDTAVKPDLDGPNFSD